MGLDFDGKGGFLRSFCDLGMLPTNGFCEEIEREIMGQFLDLEILMQPCCGVWI